MIRKTIAIAASTARPRSAKASSWSALTPPMVKRRPRHVERVQPLLQLLRWSRPGSSRSAVPVTETLRSPSIRVTCCGPSTWVTSAMSSSLTGPTGSARSSLHRHRRRRARAAAPRSAAPPSRRDLAQRRAPERLRRRAGPTAASVSPARPAATRSTVTSTRGHPLGQAGGDVLDVRRRRPSPPGPASAARVSVSGVGGLDDHLQLAASKPPCPPPKLNSPTPAPSASNSLRSVSLHCFASVSPSSATEQVAVLLPPPPAHGLSPPPTRDLVRLDARRYAAEHRLDLLGRRVGGGQAGAGRQLLGDAEGVLAGVVQEVGLQLLGQPEGAEEHQQAERRRVIQRVDRVGWRTRSPAGTPAAAGCAAPSPRRRGGPPRRPRRAAGAA